MCHPPRADSGCRGSQNPVILDFHKNQDYSKGCDLAEPNRPGDIEVP
jgi:hypothetical protein